MLRVSLAAVILASGLTPIASAAVTFDLMFRLPEGQLSSGETIIAQAGQEFRGTEIYLVETVVDGSTSVLAEANLNAYSVDISASGNDGSFRGLTLFSDGGFAGGRNSESTLNLLALGQPFGQAGRQSTDLGEGRRQALLGTVDLFAPSEPGGATTFMLLDSDAVNDGDFTTFASGSFGLEGIAANSGGAFRSGSLTVSAVPEPGSLLALTLLAAGGIAYRRRRRAKIAASL